MSDPLTHWWQHPVQVWRLTGSSARGDVFTPALTGAGEAATGFVEDGSKLVTGESGETVTSSARVALPAAVARVPLGSYVQLPTAFGSRKAKVIGSAVADGGVGAPNHHELTLQ